MGKVPPPEGSRRCQAGEQVINMQAFGGHFRPKPQHRWRRRKWGKPGAPLGNGEKWPLFGWARGGIPRGAEGGLTRRPSHSFAHLPWPARVQCMDLCGCGFLGLFVESCKPSMLCQWLTRLWAQTSPLSPGAAHPGSTDPSDSPCPALSPSLTTLPQALPLRLL